jgi:hypothetical protein
VSGAAIAGPRAMAMAGVTPAEIDVRDLRLLHVHDVITLEEYGFC